MKIFLTLLFIFTLVSSSIAGAVVESHDDHQHEEVNHKKDSNSSSDCPHLHIHCTSLCLGVLMTQINTFNPLSYVSQVTIFSHHKLSPQEFVNSLYRPPIA